MKTIILAACMLAVITICFFSLHSFGNRKHLISANNIIGRWRIDSVQNDSTKLMDSTKSHLFTKGAFYDSLPVTVEFGGDSVYTIFNKAAAKLGDDKYYFDSSKQKLFVKEDSTFKAFYIVPVNDSTMKIVFANDSAYYLMKKQP